MKAKLEFNLPEEQEEYTICCNASKYLAVIEEFKQYLRTSIKYDDDLTEEQYNTYDTIQEKFFEILNSYTITDI